jgi:hypothetical protein
VVPANPESAYDLPARYYSAAVEAGLHHEPCVNPETAPVPPHPHFQVAPREAVSRCTSLAPMARVAVNLAL